MCILCAVHCYSSINTLEAMVAELEVLSGSSPKEKSRGAQPS